MHGWQYAACLTGGSLDEVRVVKCIEACEWLTGALRGLGDVDPCYERMRAVSFLFLFSYKSLFLSACVC